MGRFLEEVADGEPLFDRITASDALHTLRHILLGLGIKNACAYRTHDLRRGHALDLQLSGAIVARGSAALRVAGGMQAHRCMRFWLPASGPRRPFSSI